MGFASTGNKGHQTRRQKIAVYPVFAHVATLGNRANDGGEQQR
jgi:hypothetical protein